MLAVFGISMCRNVYSKNIDDTVLWRLLGMRSTGKEKGLANPRYRAG